MQQHYRFELNKMQLVIDCKQEVIDDIIEWHKSQTGYYDECGKNQSYCDEKGNKKSYRCDVCEWIEKLKKKHIG